MRSLSKQINLKYIYIYKYIYISLKYSYKVYREKRDKKYLFIKKVKHMIGV